MALDGEGSWQPYVWMVQQSSKVFDSPTLAGDCRNCPALIAGASRQHAPVLTVDIEGF
jgi:hypothetical protein